MTEREIEKANLILSELKGLTKYEIEPIFKDYLFPFYRMIARYPKVESDYRIVHRDSDKEVSIEESEKRLIEIGLISSR